MVTELIEYIKDEKKNKVGVMVGIKRDDGSISIGIARCRPMQMKTNGIFRFLDGDTFDRHMGLTIARGRALKGKCAITIYNKKENEQVIKFTGRCMRYFTKDGEHHEVENHEGK